MIIKCMALWQPWATLVIEGLKKYETRSQYSSHRGLTGIHATKTSPSWARELFYKEPFLSRLYALGYKKFEDLPTGGVIGTVRVKEWLKMIEWNKQPVHPKVEINIIGDSVEKEFGNWEAGRYAIQMERPVRFYQPFPAKGTQSLLFPIDIPDHFSIVQKEQPYKDEA